MTALVFLAGGTTWHAGPDRDALRGIVLRLADSADHHGRIGFGPDPRWLRDHALATAVLAEVCAGTDDPALQRALGQAIDASTSALGLVGLVDAETLWWTAWGIDAARRSGCFADDPQPNRIDALRSALRDAVDGLPALTEQADRERLAHLRGEATHVMRNVADLDAHDRFVVACRAFTAGGEWLRNFSLGFGTDPGLVSGRTTAPWSIERAYDTLSLMIWYRHAHVPAAVGIRGLLAGR